MRVVAFSAETSRGHGPVAIKSQDAAWRAILGACRVARPADALLLLNLCDRESGAYCDCVQRRVPRVAWQAQGMRFFPRADANVRRILARALLGEHELSFVQTLLGFLGQPFGVSSDELRGAMGCRCILAHEGDGCP